MMRGGIIGRGMDIRITAEEITTTVTHPDPTTILSAQIDLTKTTISKREMTLKVMVPAGVVVTTEPPTSILS